MARRLISDWLKPLLIYGYIYIYIYMVASWLACLLAGWLVSLLACMLPYLLVGWLGWLACLTCLLACLLACWLHCERMIGKKNGGGEGKTITGKTSAPNVYKSPNGSCLWHWVYHIDLSLTFPSQLPHPMDPPCAESATRKLRWSRAKKFASLRASAVAALTALGNGKIMGDSWENVLLCIF